MDELMRWLRHWLRRPQIEPAVPVATVNTPVARRELDRMRDRRAALHAQQRGANAGYYAKRYAALTSIWRHIPVLMADPPPPERWEAGLDYDDCDIRCCCAGECLI